MDASDHQGLAVQLDLADRVRLSGDGLSPTGMPLAAPNVPVSHLAAAGKGVEGGGVRLLLVGLDAVVLSDRAVDADYHRLVHAGSVALRGGPWCRVTATYER